MTEPAASSPVVEAEVAPVEGALVGEVVVAGNAWFYADPGSEIRFRLAAVDERLSGKEGVRFAVIGAGEDWVELEAGRPSEWPSTSCVEASGELWDLGLRVFVEREALLPVTVEQTSLAFDDGTSLSLRPGTPIEAARSGDGWRLIDTWEGRVYAPVPEGAIGWSFVDLGGPRDEREADYHLRSEVTLKVGNETLELASHPDEFLVGSAVQRGDDLLVELDTSCFHAVASTPADAMTRGGGGTGEGWLSGTLGSVYSVPEGTTVHWADGSEAGRLRASYHSSEAPTARGGLRCFEALLGSRGAEDERRVELCFEAAVVEEQADASRG